MLEQSFSIAEIKGKYLEKVSRDRDKGIHLEPHNLWGHYVLRRLSYYPTWVFLKLGISANEVTLIDFLVGFAGCVILALGNYTGTIIGAFLLNIWALLDYADGHVARCRGSGSNYGEFIDSVNDHVVCSLLYISAGIGAFLSFNTYADPLANFMLENNISAGIFLVFGGIAAVLYLLLHLISYNFERMLAGNVLPFINDFKIKSFSVNIINKAGFTVNTATGIVTPALLVAAAFRALGIFISLWAIMNLVAFIFLLMRMLLRGKAMNR